MTRIIIAGDVGRVPLVTSESCVLPRVVPQARDAREFSPPLPSQVGSARGNGRGRPQRSLMLAVLRTALEDCALVDDDGARLGRRPDARARRAALDFIFSSDRSWPFSFENICETIDIDARRLRRRVSALAGHLELEALFAPYAMKTAVPSSR